MNVKTPDRTMLISKRTLLHGEQQEAIRRFKTSAFRFEMLGGVNAACFECP